MPKIKVDDQVKYVHGVRDNPFYPDLPIPSARVTAVDGDFINRVILNAEGNPTIPIKGVPHKKAKIDPDSHHWE